MASVNKVILVGNLGRDPEVRYAPSGMAVANLSVATSRAWKDKNSGERQEETEWHRVVLYDRQAEVAGEYLKKGSTVYVEGRLKTRKWTDKENVERYTTEVVCEDMKMLGAKATAAASNQSEPAANAYAGAKAGKPQAPAKPKSQTGFDTMNDDIPF